MEFWTNEEGSTYAVLDLDVLERGAFTEAAEHDPHGIGRRLPFFEGVAHLWQYWVVDFGDITLLVPPSLIPRQAHCLLSLPFGQCAKNSV